MKQFLAKCPSCSSSRPCLERGDCWLDQAGTRTQGAVCRRIPALAKGCRHSMGTTKLRGFNWHERFETKADCGNSNLKGQNGDETNQSDGHTDLAAPCTNLRPTCGSGRGPLPLARPAPLAHAHRSMNRARAGGASLKGFIQEYKALCSRLLSWAGQLLRRHVRLSGQSCSMTATVSSVSARPLG